MGLGNLWLLTLFSLFIFFNSGSSFSDKPPSEANQQNTILKNQENEIPFSSSESSPELDTIPIVNPTTPGTTPTPIIDPPSPPAPISMEPGINPTTPTTVPTTNIPASSGGTWCIANPTASPTALQVAIDYACGYGGADCLGIQPGAGCYEPNTLKDHASYAFNDYYQKNPAPTSCVFGGTAQLTYTDPSHDNCHYASSRTTPSITTPVNPMTPTTPTMSQPTTPTMSQPTTPTMSTPTDSTAFGSEPTGTPSSATTLTSKQLLLLSTMAGLLGTLLAASHL